VGVRGGDDMVVKAPWEGDCYESVVKFRRGKLSGKRIRLRRFWNARETCFWRNDAAINLAASVGRV
jgi:hypothetical protein